MRLIVTLLISFIFCNLSAQDVVKWTYSSKKIADKKYEIHMKATVLDPWHLYSQFTPEGGPLPTTIHFTNNPLLSNAGHVKENGKMLKKYEDVFDVDVHYFDGEVDFTQVVTLKTNVKTSVGGTIEFMACNDVQCLPPKTVQFSIPLE